MAGIDWEQGTIRQPAAKGAETQPDWEQGEIRGPAGFTRKAGDLGLSVLKGAVSLPEAAVGLADIPTGGRVGKFLENEGGAIGFRPKQAKEVLSGFQSADLRAKTQAFQNADGVLDKAGVALSNPSLIANAVAESAALMGAGGIIGRGLMAGTGGRLGAVGAGAIGEGIVGAGSAASQTRQETEDGYLTPTQAGLAGLSGVATAGFGALGGRVAQKLGIGDVDTLIAQGSTEVASQAPKGFLRRGAEGAFAEGVLEELPQSLSEQAIQNVALERPVTEGLADAAVMGTLAGGVMGAGAGMLAGQTAAAQPTQEPDTNTPPSPLEPQTTAPTGGAEATGFRPGGVDFGQRPPTSLDEAALQAAGVYPQTTLDTGRIDQLAGEPVKPSQAMGLNPEAGPLSAAATVAVDGGAAPVIDLSAATPEDRAAYDAATFDPAKTRQGVQERKRARIEELLERASMQGNDSPAQESEDFDVPFGDGPISDAAGITQADAGAVPGMAGTATSTASTAGVPGADTTDRAGQSQRFPALNGQTPQATATTGQKVKSLKDFMARKRAEREAANVQNAPQSADVTGPEENVIPEAASPEAAAPAGADAAAPAGVPAAGAAPGVEAAGLKVGDTVRIRGQEEKVRVVDAIGEDGYVYLKDGTSFPADKAAELLFKSEPNKDAGTFGGSVAAPEDRSPSNAENQARWKQESGAITPEAVTQPAQPVTPGEGAEGSQPTQVAPNIVEHTTAKGKVLRGVVRKDMTLDQAKAYDPYAFKKDGGVFIREQHLDKLPASTTEPTDGTQTGKTITEEAKRETQGPQTPDATAGVAEAGADEQGAQWNRMTTIEREAVATRAGLNKVAVKNLARRGWQGLDRAQQQNLRKGFERPTAQTQGGSPADFIPAPDGGLDYGEITPAMAKEMRRQAGKIRLQRGDATFGLQHIEERHGKEIREAGFNSIEEFVSGAVSDIESVWRPAATSQLVVIQATERGKVVFIQLQSGRDESGDFYSVRTAFPSSRSYAEKRKEWKKLWSRVPVPATDAGASASSAEPGNEAGPKNAMESSQSSDRSVAQPTQGAQVDEQALRDRNLADAASEVSRLTQLRNDLIDINTRIEQQGQVVDDRLIQRRRQIQAAIKELESDSQQDELPDDMRATEAGLNANTRAADRNRVAQAQADALREREKAAKAKMLNAAAKLADLLSKNTRLNITPEQEQAMLPIAIELFEGAMELGYVKFKQAAKYVRQFIANAIDQEAADALPVDTLQGAYIAVSRRHRDKAVTPKAEVITVDSVQEIDAEVLDAPENVAQNSNETEPSNERSTVRIEGQEALDGVATQEGGRAEGDRPVGVRAERDGARGTEAAGGADGTGVQAPRSGRGGDARVRSAATGGAGRGRLGAQGAGRAGGAVPQDDAGAARPGSTDQSGVSPEQAPASIPAANFQITADTRLGQGGEVQKFNDNIEAIRVVKRLDAENRRATPEEQRALARYVGWGGLANAFPDPITGEFKDRWQERGALLRELLTDAEYAAARRSTRNAHYTAETVVTGMWDIARRLGFRGGLALENSIGTGNFVGLMPGDLNARFVGVEYDSLTSRIAGALYPQATVLHAGFQNVPLPDNAFALNIGNPPFGSESLRFQYKPELAGKSIHNQFFLAGMDALRPGGLQIKVVSRFLLDAQDTSSRLALASKARLVGAIRLPDNAFRENARTEVVTDIVIMQKLTPAEQAEMALAIEAYMAKGDKNGRKTEEQQRLAAKVPAWVETVKVPDPLGGEAMTVNAYFRENPRNVLGVMERSGSMRQGADLTVRLDNVADLPGLLSQAIDRLPRDIHSLDAEVAAATEQRFKSLSDSLRIALANEEPGHLAYDRDGKLQRVVERETPEGGFEFSRMEVTPDTPWSEQLSQDAQGRWFKNEVQLDAEGKPVKLLNKDGVATKRNAYTRTVYASEADVPASLKLGQTAFARLQGIVKMRDLLKRQLELETSDAAQAAMEGNRRALAKAYEDFVAEHGPIGRPVNLRLTETMPDGGLVAALEVSYQPKRTAEQAAKTGLERQNEVAKPAPILRERVVPKYEPATRADTPADALAISLAETGRVNMERIAALLGKTEDEAAAALQEGAKPLVFKDPESNTWETANNYLSGMVKRKLNAAREAGLAMNVAALEAVQPQPWTAENVSVMLGSTWVPPDVYAGFVEHLTGGKAKVSFSPLTNAFSLNLSGASREKASQWSSEGAPVDYIVTRLLNSQAVVVMEPDSEGTTRTNQEATSLAVLKSKEISAEFLDWVLKDGDRRARLVELFNEKFNTRVVRQYDGSHLKLPGKVPDSIIAMRRHQMNAIWRGIYERFLLVDHAVGAGKTFTAIARAMERRRMGLSQKPMVVVPNHLVEQWAADVYRLYPGAKVLAAGKKDFEAKRRRRLFARIATGDWDIVIVPHSSFGFIGIAPETEQRYLQRELQTAMDAVQDAWEQAKEDGTDNGRRKPFGVKEAERLAEKIQARMDNLNAGKKDRLLTFEQLGVDDLTVDEAHEFKNLYYSSRLTGVRGMGDKTGSRKANDLYNKVRVLAENPDASVTFLTGTPISNSAVEMFTMMRFLAADSLKEMGLEHFDAWRAQYVEATPAFEPTESGRLKEVTRLGRTWSNMRSLMDLYYQFTDAVSLEDIKQWYSEDNNGAPFPVPRLKGGDRKLVAIQPTAAQDAELKAVMAGFDGLDGIADPYERNAERLRLMDRARKLSLDMRAVDPRTTSKEEGGKLEVASREIKRIYDKWNADKGTQLVFLDRSVPKSKGDDKVLKEYDDLVAKRDQALRSGDDEKYLELSEALERFDADEMEAMRVAQAGGWNAYQQIKDNLVALGIPANEIRFIQEATNDEQKLALFDAVNGGKVRVLIGSTPRMGAGTNVQQRAVALHHIDVTWKPSDIEQREGRVIRQGNLIGFDKDGNPIRPDFEVEILAYATERTVDAKMWDLNATKLRTINGIRKYDGAFTMEFEDADAVGMAEMAALASGNPLLLERVKLESELSTLELQERAHRRKMYGIQDALDAARRAIERNPAQIEREKAQMAETMERLQALEASVSARAVTVEGQRFTSLPDAMRAAMAAIELQQEGNDKARFAITIDGERVTSKTAVEEAIAAAIGDAQPFEAQVNGKTLTQRTAAAREVAGLVNAAKAGMTGDATQEVELGMVLGYRMVADLERKVRNGDGLMNVSITALGDDGRTLASESANEQPAQVAYSATHLRGPIERLFERIQRKGSDSTVRYLERQLADAQRDLPELEAKVKAPFPKAEEMAAKRGRLAELVQDLEGRATKAASSNEVDAPKFSQGLLAPKGGPKPTLQQIQALVEKVQQVAKNALPVTVTASPSDVPGLEVPAGSKPTGVMTGGRIILFADNIRSTGDAYATLFHEFFHLGLQKVIPAEDYATVLKRFANNPLAQKLVRDWKNSEEGRQRAVDLPSAAYEALATEEALAMVAEELSVDGIGTRRMPAMVRHVIAWLSGVADRLGFPPAFSDWMRGLTQNDAERFVSDMTRAALGGERNLARTRAKYGTTAREMTQQTRLRGGDEEVRLASIFEGLQGNAQDKLRAQRELRADPRAEAVRDVEANFMDMLARLDDAKLVEINC